MRPLRVTYVTVLPKRYRTGPLVSLRTIALPGRVLCDRSVGVGRGRRGGGL